VAGVAKRGSIDQEAVLDAALSVARRVGLDKLSMRMVADELGVTPMAAYRHVADRNTLVSLVADRLASTVEVPDPDSGTWEERLRQLECAAFHMGTEVPGQPDTTVVTWGPSHRKIVDGLLAIFADAGFDDTDTAIAFEVTWAYFIGQVRIHEHLVARLEGYVEGGTSNSYPVLARVVDRAPPVSPEEHFERGLDIIIAGLRDRLETKQALAASANGSGGVKPARSKT
jgi:TetR/AcrR family transcriptional regulator, tetracycline repressor protein